MMLQFGIHLMNRLTPSVARCPWRIRQRPRHWPICFNCAIQLLGEVFRAIRHAVEGNAREITWEENSLSLGGLLRRHKIHIQQLDLVLFTDDQITVADNLFHRKELVQAVEIPGRRLGDIVGPLTCFSVPCASGTVRRRLSTARIACWIEMHAPHFHEVISTCEI